MESVILAIISAYAIGATVVAARAVVDVTRKKQIIEKKDNILDRQLHTIDEQDYEIKLLNIKIAAAEKALEDKQKTLEEFCKKPAIAAMQDHHVLNIGSAIIGQIKAYFSDPTREN